LTIAFHGLRKTGGAAGALHITFITSEFIEILFLVFYIIVFERECEYFGSIAKLFTCDEVKEKLANFGLHRFKLPTSNIRMERLVEESPSLPV